MDNIQVWYTIEKHNNMWTVWLNKEFSVKDKKGSGGSLGLFSHRRKKECIEYCKKNNISIEK